MTRKLKRHFILNVGATNTGKTYAALQALKQSTSGVYLSPLRLLAMEVQDSLNDNGCLCSLSTGEEEDIVPNATIMSSTVEKLDIHQHYSVGVVDECQMVSDGFRGGAWTRTILGLCADTVYLCMAPEALSVCIQLIELCNDTYEIVECKRRVPLNYCQPVCTNDLKKGDAIIVFSRRDVFQYASELEKMKFKVSVIYGALPYKARKRQVELYKNGTTDIVVATDAIGMGLNLPIKRILFAKDEKFDGVTVRPLLPSEAKQIAGRAGRLGIYNEGFYGVLQNSGATGTTIKMLVETAHKDIRGVSVPFPEECICDSFSVSSSMTMWKNIEYSIPFYHENIEETVNRVEYLEKNYSHFDNKTIYNLASVIFDEKREELNNLWMEYVAKYKNNIAIEVPEIFDSTLEDYELMYKKMDLYYSFC